MLTGLAGLAGGASQATLKCRNPPIYSTRMRATHQSLATAHPSAHSDPRAVGTVHYTIASATMPPPESRHAPVISAGLHHLCAGRRQWSPLRDDDVAREPVLVHPGRAHDRARAQLVSFLRSGGHTSAPPAGWPLAMIQISAARRTLSECLCLPSESIPRPSGMRATGSTCGTPTRPSCTGHAIAAAERSSDMVFDGSAPGLRESRATAANQRSTRVKPTRRPEALY